MKRITIYHNKDCDRCRKIARVHRMFDWLDRVEVSTATPKTGPLHLGEIAVEDHQSGETFKGVNAVRLICRNIPAYTPLRPLLWVPFIARRIEKELQGCTDGRCVVSATQTVS